MLFVPTAIILTISHRPIIYNYLLINIANLAINGSAISDLLWKSAFLSIPIATAHLYRCVTVCICVCICCLLFNRIFPGSSYSTLHRLQPNPSFSSFYTLPFLVIGQTFGILIYLRISKCWQHGKCSIIFTFDWHIYNWYLSILNVKGRGQAQLKWHWNTNS